MPDVVTPDVRSRMMAGIRGKNTRPEMLLRRGLHALGWRYRLHGRGIPGRPDLVFAPRRALVFANGCFWHGHACHLFRWPQSRPGFWREKIASNIARDERIRERLLADGWRVAEVWECTLKGRERRPLPGVLAELEAFLRSEEKFLSVGGGTRVAVPPTEAGSSEASAGSAK